MNPQFIPQVQSRSEKALGKAGLFVANCFKKAVPKDTRELEKSIFSELKGKKVVRVGSLLWSAYVQEKGRQPGKMPSLDSLVGWTIRKKGLPGNKTQPWKEQPSETKSVIFLIARKIGTRGIKAKETFSKTWEANKAKATQIYFDTLKR